MTFEIEIETKTVARIKTADNQVIELLQIGQEYRIDSRIVSANIGIDHQNFIQTLRAYQENLEEEFGSLMFETEVKGFVCLKQTNPPTKNAGGRPETYVMLNHGQVFLAISFSRNTKEVVAWKTAIIAALIRLDRQVQSGLAKPRGIHKPHAQREPSIPILTEKAVKTIKLLNERGNLTPTARDIARQMHKQSNVVQSILESLVQEGIVQSIQGRQTLKYVLVSSPDTASS